MMKPVDGCLQLSKPMNTEHLNIAVRSNRRSTLRMLSIQLNFNRFTVHQILAEYLFTHANYHEAK